MKPGHFVCLLAVLLTWTSPTGLAQSAPASSASTRPSRLIARMGRPRFYHGAPIMWTGYSPDGKVIATIVGNRLEKPASICFWEAGTGRLIRRVTISAGRLFAGSFSPDGRTLAIYSNTGKVSVMDVASGKLVRVLTLPPGIRPALTITPGGKRLTAVGTREIKEWDLASGKELRKISHKSRFTAISPDGKVLAQSLTISRKVIIELRNPWKASVLHTISYEKSNPYLRSMRFSPDGKYLVIDLRTRTGDNNAYIDVIDVRTGLRVWRTKTSARGSRTIAVSPDGKLIASWDYNRKLDVYDWAANKMVASFTTLSGSNVNSMQFSPDGKVIASGCYDGLVRLFDVSSGKELHAETSVRSAVQMAAFSSDARRVVLGCADGTVRLWNVETGKRERLPGKSRLGVSWVAFAPDDSSVAASYLSGEVDVWNLTPGKAIAPPMSISVRLPIWVGYPDDGGALLTIEREGEIAKWSLPDGTKKNFFHVRTRLDYAAGSSDGSVAVTSMGSLGRFWDLRTGREMSRLESPVSRILGRFSLEPSGTHCAWVNPKGSLIVAETVSGKVVMTTELPRKWRKLGMVAFAPGGRLIAVGGDDAIVTLFDAAGGKKLLELKGHIGSITGLSFSRDARRLVSCSMDMTAVVWDVSGITLPPLPEVADDKFDLLWEELASPNAKTAYAAWWALLNVPDRAVQMLAGKMKPEKSADERRIEELIAQLADARFVVREKAHAELKKLGVLAEAMLTRAMKLADLAEVQLRVRTLLEAIADPAKQTPDDYRDARAMQVLQRVRSPRAVKLLEALAAGAPSARRTKFAKASLEKIKAGGSAQITAKKTP